MMAWLRHPVLKIYAVSLVVSLLVFVAVTVGLGTAALLTTAILAVLEISLSFDNAVVNAKVLQRMSPTWRLLFLTVGILIAVVGVRLLLPIVLVAVFAHLGVGQVVQLALHDATAYGRALHHIHPEVAGFGGVFLLLLFTDYLLETRSTLWLAGIERPLAALGRIVRLEMVLVLVGLLSLALASAFVPPEHVGSMLLSGLVGMALYLVIAAVDGLLERRQLGQGVARIGLMGFIYLELLDASFSLDGVLGAFAITDQLPVIVAGLGIGALWVRSMTIHLIRTDTLARFRYLEHGAHYAIGALAVLLLISASYEVSEAVTGLIGLGIIAAAVTDSVRANRSDRSS
jgi:hypothetical protein